MGNSKSTKGVKDRWRMVLVSLVDGRWHRTEMVDT